MQGVQKSCQCYFWHKKDCSAPHPYWKWANSAASDCELNYFSPFFEGSGVLRGWHFEFFTCLIFSVLNKLRLFFSFLFSFRRCEMDKGQRQRTAWQHQQTDANKVQLKKLKHDRRTHHFKHFQAAFGLNKKSILPHFISVSICFSLIYTSPIRCECNLSPPLQPATMLPASCLLLFTALYDRQLDVRSTAAPLLTQDSLIVFV